MKDKEIIFQVRILRKDEGFEMVKTGLSNFEQIAFEDFLRGYLKTLEKDRIEEYRNMIQYKED